MRSDGTLDIVLGSLVAGVGAYVYQFLGGRSLGEEAFAPIGALLTAHFLAFVIILLPIEQFVIRRITLGYRGWVVPMRAIALTISAAFVAAVVVWASADTYFDGDASFVWFVIATESVPRVGAVIERIRSATGLPVLDFPKSAEYYVGLRFEA